MTDDERALLAAILANPDDDLPRLVYADWLEERGGPGDAERAAMFRAYNPFAVAKAMGEVVRTVGERFAGVVGAAGEVVRGTRS